jgi:hypothetical protein
MGQQAVVARTGFDEEREANKRVLNTLILNTSLNERLNVIELNSTSNARVPCLSVCLLFRLW